MNRVFIVHSDTKIITPPTYLLIQKATSTTVRIRI